MNRFPAKPPTTVWGTYLRCHDDIGWAIDDGDAASVGLTGFEHRRFLAEYYAGLYPMSDARGLVFQENLLTGDRRISGTSASLAGIEAALNSGDDFHLDLAIRRYLLAYSLVLGFGGLPLIYMGDELGLLNYYDFVEDPDHADDNRWVHRPPMPWDWVDRRHIEGTVEYRIWHGLRHIITVRSSLPSLDASLESEILDPVNPAVLVFLRRFPTQTMVGVYNMTTESQKLPRWVIPLGNWAWDALTEETPLSDGQLTLGGYQVRWFVQQT
jgi:amylosucrase